MFRMIEKASYIVGVPILLGFSGYKLYQHAMTSEEVRMKELKDLEEKYL
jgi:hypothetical protein